MNSSDDARNHSINGDGENTSLLSDDSIRAKEFISSHQSQTSLSPRGTSINSRRNDSNRTQGISWYFAVFLIVNAALGGGLLNFAHAYDDAGGIVVSSVVQSVCINSLII